MCGSNEEIKALFADLSDDDIAALDRAAFDPVKIHAAYQAAVQHKNQPTVILVLGVKGYGLGTNNAESRNIAHNQLEMKEEELKTFRNRFKLPLTDEELVNLTFL